MFSKLFRKDKKPAGADAGANAPNPATAALLRTIAAKKKEDPLIGVKIGAQETAARFMAAFKKEKGVHIESYLTALAALTGFACQMAVREELVKTGKAPEQGAFVIVKDSAGNVYYFGDALNKYLAEDKMAVWPIIGGGIQQAGGALPDIQDIFAHCAKTVGTESFGKPRVPPQHQTAHDTPQNYIRAFWPKTLPLLNMFCDRPAEWPIMLALSLQPVLAQAKAVINPKDAGMIIMETAIAMAKIDPKSVGVEV